MAGLFAPSNRANGSGNNSSVPNVKLTPSGTPYNSLRTPAKTTTPKRVSSEKPGASSKEFPNSTLALKRVIGCSTTAFDSHPPSRSFAYTAGASAVVVSLDDDLNIQQRFFRARPNAATLTIAAQGAAYTPSTPQNAAQESRTRAAASLREAGIGYSPGGAVYYGDDSPSSKTWTARERIKAATCLSFSPDGKWLAVGETGYNPRVLIFSMAKEVPSDVPVAAMAEHTFGVRDVAFSPDSKYLASIGTANDGFIYIWSLNPGRQGLVQLYASNKCTSFIRQITWMGRCLVTVGIRHVKLWKTDDDVGDGNGKTKRKWRLTHRRQKVSGNGVKVLYGRNALLGNMSDSTLSCVVAISDSKAIVCSEKGDVCLLDEAEMKLSKVAEAGFKVNCVAIDPERKFAWVAGKNGSTSSLVLKEIIPPTPPASPSSSRSSSPVLPSGCRKADVMAMANMLGHLFTLDSNCSLKIINMTTVDGVPTPNTMIRELPAHKQAVLGVRILPKDHISGANFFTWAADGAVMFWDMEGKCEQEFQVEVEQPAENDDDGIANELKVVRVSKDGDFFVAGDKYGVLRIIDGETRECIYDVKAHSGEIMDIVIHNNTVATAARDRTVQVFSRSTGEWNLVQTLDDHTASVSRVLFLQDGSKLLSCSTDRTIVVRELCRREGLDGSFTEAYVPIRTLNTKSSPTHMTTFNDNSTTLLVSTLDRQILKFDMVSGQTISSFKVTDTGGGDAVVMDAISLTEDRGPGGKPRFIVGTCTTDKSIRLYDLNGGLIDKEWGHTEGVSDVALLESSDDGTMKLISTGTDGTIMIWDFLTKDDVPSPQKLADSPFADSPAVPTKELTATRTPLRRVLSRSELQDFVQGQKLPDPARVSSGSQSVGSTSPPRPTVRKKTSAYSLNRYSRIGSTFPQMSSSATTPTQEKPPASLSPQPPHPSDSEAISPVTPSFKPPLTPTTSSAIGTPTPVPNLTRTNSTPPTVTPQSASGRESRRSASRRGRTPSPPDGPRITGPPPAGRRSSYDTRTRGKSDPPNTVSPAPNNVNGLAESLVRSLRSFRKRLDRAETAAAIAGDVVPVVRPEVMRDLHRELGMVLGVMGDSAAGTAASLSKASGKTAERGIERKPGSQSLSSMAAAQQSQLQQQQPQLLPAIVSGSTENDMMAAMLEQYSAKLLSMVNDRLEDLTLQRADTHDSSSSVGEDMGVSPVIAPGTTVRRGRKVTENTGDG